MKINVLLLCVLFLFCIHAYADLVAYWPLNEGAGQIAGDASGNGNDGTLGDTISPETADLGLRSEPWFCA